MEAVTLDPKAHTFKFQTLNLHVSAVHSGNGVPAGLRVRLLGARHSGGGVLIARDPDVGSGETRPRKCRFRNPGGLGTALR